MTRPSRQGFTPPHLPLLLYVQSPPSVDWIREQYFRGGSLDDSDNPDTAQGVLTPYVYFVSSLTLLFGIWTSFINLFRVDYFLTTGFICSLRILGCYSFVGIFFTRFLKLSVKWFLYLYHLFVDFSTRCCRQ